MKNASEPQVLFRGRLVAHDYPERHAAAQISRYDDFVDGVPRDRIRYGDPRDRNPGGITYATREERITYRIEERQRMLAKLAPGDVVGRAWVDNIFPHKDDPNDLIGPNEEIRTDHRCGDCDVDVGDFHLPGCGYEACPICGGQCISCGCAAEMEEAEDEAENEPEDEADELVELDDPSENGPDHDPVSEGTDEVS